jgi:hypothetical protein
MVQTSARRRLLGLAIAVVLGLGLFMLAGTVWEGAVDRAQAVSRFRAAGPAAAEPVPGLPEPGVYAYRTTGGERVSFLDYERAYTSTTYRIVTRQGCGVREEQYFLVQHVEYYDRCGPRLASYGTDIAFWWTHGTQAFKCTGGSFDASDLPVLGQVEWECRDEDTVAHQVTAYLGDERVVVDGQPVDARHVRWRTVFDGATKGAAVVEDWFAVDTGLVLRETRNIGLRVGSPFIGDISYIDVSTYELESTTPAR